MVGFCFLQAEVILEAWATQALQNDYGRDLEVTQIWNSTMTEVRGVLQTPIKLGPVGSESIP